MSFRAWSPTNSQSRTSRDLNPNPAPYWSLFRAAYASRIGVNSTYCIGSPRLGLPDITVPSPFVQVRTRRRRLRRIRATDACSDQCQSMFREVVASTQTTTKAPTFPVLLPNEMLVRLTHLKRPNKTPLRRRKVIYFPALGDYVLKLQYRKK